MYAYVFLMSAYGAHHYLCVLYADLGSCMHTYFFCVYMVLIITSTSYMQNPCICAQMTRHVLCVNGHVWIHCHNAK